MFGNHSKSGACNVQQLKGLREAHHPLTLASSPSPNSHTSHTFAAAVLPNAREQAHQPAAFNQEANGEPLLLRPTPVPPSFTTLPSPFTPPTPLQLLSYLTLENKHTSLPPSIKRQMENLQSSDRRLSSSSQGEGRDAMSHLHTFEQLTLAVAQVKGFGGEGEEGGEGKGARGRRGRGGKERHVPPPYF